MEVNTPSKDLGFQEKFMNKNRLQEFTQKSALPLPVYHTVNEGYQHAPQFRSTVVVDGVTFTSPCTYFNRKAAEQDVAKLALDSISRKIENEGVPLIQEGAIFCKSILHEYAVKMNLEKPTYTTCQAGGTLPAFASSSIFNGQTYTGDPARNKKEAEQMAARVVIESILANSNTRSLMCEIIRSKGKLYAPFCRKGSSSGLLSERNPPSGSHTQNNPNDTINGKEVLENSANIKLLESMRSMDQQIVKATATETFAPEAKKLQEEYTCALNYGPDGNGSSQSTLLQGGSLAEMTSNTANSSDGSLAHNQINNGVNQIGPSTRSEDSVGVVLASGMKRSDSTENESNESKKARTIEQSPTPPANPESSLKNA